MLVWKPAKQCWSYVKNPVAVLGPGQTSVAHAELQPRLWYCPLLVYLRVSDRSDGLHSLISQCCVCKTCCLNARLFWVCALYLPRSTIRLAHSIHTVVLLIQFHFLWLQLPTVNCGRLLSGSFQNKQFIRFKGAPFWVVWWNFLLSRSVLPGPGSSLQSSVSALYMLPACQSVAMLVIRTTAIGSQCSCSSHPILLNSRKVQSSYLDMLERRRKVLSLNEKVCVDRKKHRMHRVRYYAWF